MARQALNLAFLALLSTVVVGLPASAQTDGSKRAAELPLKKVIDGPQLTPGVLKRMDMSKGGIELPFKGVLKGSQPFNAGSIRVNMLTNGHEQKVAKPVVPVKTLGSTQKPGLKQPRNEKVEPGKVRWHKAIQTAMDASKQSGKPVLLFQMMGHLDDRFC